VIVAVPPGTQVDGLEGRRYDLVEPGQRAVVAQGGLGGHGNKRFASSTRQTPRFAERGLPGESGWIELRLKLIADAGLVGLPNAGKSSLLSRVTRATPKVADYPFTTLEPALGTIDDGERQLVLADIPGLIEGAAEGKGLGHQFLRHVERARVLLVLIDLAAADGMSPAEQESILLGELERYKPELIERPRLIVGSKADVAASEFDGPVVSAVTGDGLREVVGQLADLVREARASVPAPVSYAVHRPAVESFTVQRDDDGSFVSSRIPTSEEPPANLPLHLEESFPVRAAKAEAKIKKRSPPDTAD